MWGSQTTSIESDYSWAILNKMNVQKFQYLDGKTDRDVA